MGTAKRERQKANRQLRLEQMAKQSRKQKTKKRALQLGIGIPAAVILLIVVIFLMNDSGDDSAEPTGSPVDTSVTDTTPVASGEFVYGTGECAPAEKPAEPVRTFTDAPQECIDPTTGYTAVVETNKGSFTIALDPAGAPGNVNNFVTLADYGYYDGTDCHRVIADFVVQCGRPGEDEDAPGYTVPDELPSRPYQIGDVAMANTGAPDSGGGQWFVITGDNGAALPSSYTIIGSVTEGMDTTVAALAALADPSTENGVPPKETITITSVTVTESDAPATTEPGTTEPGTTEPAGTDAPADTAPGNTIDSQPPTS